jgi:hypothetical protein
MVKKEKKPENLCYFIDVLDVSQKDNEGNCPVIEVIGPLAKPVADNIAGRFWGKYKGNPYVVRVYSYDVEYSPDQETVIRKWGLEYY